MEGANCTLDTGHTTCCKTLSVSCDCSLLLSVIGSKCRVHLLFTLSACSVKLAAPTCATEDRTSLEKKKKKGITQIVYASLEVLCLKLLQIRDFLYSLCPRFESRRSRAKAGSLQTTLLLLGPPREAVKKQKLSALCCE